MTQRERVLKMLEEAGPRGVSSKTFIASYMPRAAARIQELKDLGYEISAEREGKYVRYRLGENVALRSSNEGASTSPGAPSELFPATPYERLQDA